MAREFIDGFETGDVSMWDEASGASCVAASAKGMQGGYCLWVNYGYVIKNVTARDEYWVAVKYRYPDPYSYDGTPIIAFKNGNTVLGGVYLYTGNLFKITRGMQYDPVLVTGPNLAVDTVYLIEAHYKPRADTNGKFTVKVNGVIVMDFDGQTSASTVQIDRIRFGNGYNYHYYDDVVIESAGWVGVTNIQALLPTGAGDTTQFTPTSGANYTCMDEVPPNDTDYVASNTLNATDTYQLSNLTGPVGSIKAVQIATRASFAGSPACTTLRGIFNVGGTPYTSTNVAQVSTAYKTLAFIKETNPVTSSAWTPSEVDALTVGLKITT